MATSIPVPVVPIRDEDRHLFRSINSFVHAYMSTPTHDNSHDYTHILRVLSNANMLLASERTLRPTVAYDPTTIFLAALLHDVGDHKYTQPGACSTSSEVSQILLDRGAPKELAMKVQTIVKNVGYTNEVKDPKGVSEVLGMYPELAIVQDADRLDAIGAIGVGRCFAYGGAKGQGRPLSGAIDHFEEKLVRLPNMMKTETGRKFAASRNKILEDFAMQFQEEANLSFDLEPLDTGE